MNYPETKDFGASWAGQSNLQPYLHTLEFPPFQRYLKFYVAYYIAAVAEPFAVLLGCWLLHSDFALSDEFFKPIFTADEFCHSRLAERDSEPAEHEAHQVELVAVGYVGVTFHHSFISSAI